MTLNSQSLRSQRHRGTHTYIYEQTPAHSCTLCSTLTRKRTELLSLWEGDAFLKHSFTNYLPVNYTTADRLLRILEQLSNFLTEKSAIESSWDSQSCYLIWRNHQDVNGNYRQSHSYIIQPSEEKAKTSSPH